MRSFDYGAGSQPGGVLEQAATAEALLLANLA